MTESVETAETTERPKPTTQIEAARKNALAFDLRRQGLTYREIGKRFGASPASAHRRVMRGQRAAGSYD